MLLSYVLSARIAGIGGSLLQSGASGYRLVDALIGSSWAYRSRTMRLLFSLLNPPSRRERAARKYFAQIDPGRPTDERIAEVSTAIQQDGRWSESIEWRICTVMESTIEPIERDGCTWYRVSVKCCYEFCCECPTLPRAVEFQWIYAALISDLFWNLGWPSWSSRFEL